MKKIIALVLCFAMLASMAVTASAASVQLPDGGSRQNTGCSTAFGYTDGGTLGRARMTCTIEIASTSNGKVVAEIGTNVSMGSNAYLNVIAWQDAAHQYKLAGNDARSPATTAASYSLCVYGGTATTSGTAGYEYSSAEYGYWLCGTTTD